MRSLTFFVLAGGTFLSIQPPAKASRDTFANVNVAGIPIRNLDRTAALRRLRRELQPKLQTTITLAGGPRALKRRRKDLGIELDLGWMLARAGSTPKSTAQSVSRYVPLKLRVHRGRSVSALRRLAPRFQINPRAARPIYSAGKVRIRPERNGVRLNAGGSLVRLRQNIEKNAATRRIELAVDRPQPALTRARLKGVNDILATFTTRFNPRNRKRTRNMRLGIRAINGTLLSPGEIFSLNKTVGERTQAKGYRTTIIFKNGYKVAGIGGGISQVTGTLFNAALMAGLPIVSYRTHSRPVDYLPLGRDATVAWGSFDMKFKNHLGAPIYISYTLRGNRATARLYGPQTNQKVSLRVVSRQIGPREIKAKLFRTIRQNGKVVSKAKVGESHYQWKVGDWEE